MAVFFLNTNILITGRIYTPEEMIKIMIPKNIIKYEHDGVEGDDDKNGCN